MADLIDGEGTIVSATSGALPSSTCHWASRAEEPNGKTSPEELIAAALRIVLLDGAHVRPRGTGWEPAGDSCEIVGDRHVPARRGDHRRAR